MKQHMVRIALGLLIVLVLVGHAAEVYRVGVITQLDNLIYDTRLRLTMPGTINDRIVILDIDEKSLAVPDLGRWPWSREQLASLIDKLFDKYGVAIVAFHVVFAERDSSSGLKVARSAAYLTNMSGIIRSTYRGTLDKYIGDAIMAFWGAPVDATEHARNGILAALAMQRMRDAERALRAAGLAVAENRDRPEFG